MRVEVEVSRMKWVVFAAVVAWGSAIAAGFAAILVHAATPGAAGPAVEQWPKESRIPLAKDRCTLIMTAHPRCPCTRASASELARILARCEGRIALTVLLFTPTDSERPWAPPAWAGRLSALPGVRVLADPGGCQAALFGARTSGHVVLYSPAGRLLYCGGITGARGHEGDNAGREAVIALVTARSPASTKGPVFGCSIR